MGWSDLNPYETDRLLSEYLLFHYGTAEEILTGEVTAVGPEVLDYAVRCVELGIDPGLLPPNARALDLGCAVGRSSFELARHCPSVVGIDSSKKFIEAAQILRERGELAYERVDEGALTTPLLARVPSNIDRGGLHFEVGDATRLRDNMGNFDVVLAANLLCRLPKPRFLLDRLPGLVKPGGQLILSTPCTWLEEFTTPADWLGSAGKDTLASLRMHLDPTFDLIGQRDLPFLIREHRRKFQLSLALLTIWRRRE